MSDPVDKRKHIAVTDKTHQEFKMMARLKGMTHEGLIRHFIEKEVK